MNPKCPICRKRAEYWESIRGETKKTKNQTFDLYKCSSCGHGFYHPGFNSEKDLIKYYDEDFAIDYNPEIMTQDFILRRKQYIKDTELLKTYLKKRYITILDYGCSTGQLLEMMPCCWRKHGYEISEFKINYMRKNCKKIKVVMDLAKLKRSEYDVIVLRGVIEHLFDFKTLFGVLSRSLKKDGLIFICATPNFASPCAVLYGRDWNLLRVAPFHYHQFTPTSLSILFARHGFCMVGLHHPYLGTPYAKGSDGGVFVRNVRRLNKNNIRGGSCHAYPGNMMSCVFKKVRR